MPKTKEEKRKYYREYQKKRRENPEVKKKDQEYRDKNRESIREKTKLIQREKRLDPEYLKKEKEYREKPEVIKQKKERMKNWRQSITGKKSRVICTWKSNGIIDEDFESLYEVFLEETNCWICGHDFSKSKKCLDHDHKTGEVRYICCTKCNVTVLNSNITNQFVKIIFEEY